jgi:hypothetical protein
MLNNVPDKFFGSILYHTNLIWPPISLMIYAKPRFGFSPNILTKDKFVSS